jgi:modulator of FtsH protease
VDDGFAALADWHEFFGAVAGAAATLVGLLFVALALNPAVMADHGPAGLRTWAGQTFNSFLMVMVFALIALIPDVGPAGLGVPLVLLGGWGLARVALDVRRVRGDPAPEWHGRHVLARFASPLAGYAAATWAGIQIFRGDAEAIGWLVPTIFFLTMSAASNCWDLLREIGDLHRVGTGP